MQLELFADTQPICSRPTGALLKWIGSKYKMAAEICLYFPKRYGTYYEVFLGGGAVLATLAPRSGIGSDCFAPLIEIWQTLKENPAQLKAWYSERWEYSMEGEKVERYEEIKASYNARPNPADFLFLTRACYGGVVRFRKTDGYMSTPCGPHTPISPMKFSKRVDEWHHRVIDSRFFRADYTDMMAKAEPGDLIYCDPPYIHSQAILYGSQDFSLEQLLEMVQSCKRRGVYVALSIDGSKRSGNTICDLPVPSGLFEQEIFIDAGRSMLKRFQMDGRSLEGEVVADRLLLTY